MREWIAEHHKMLGALPGVIGVIIGAFELTTDDEAINQIVTGIGAILVLFGVERAPRNRYLKPMLALMLMVMLSACVGSPMSADQRLQVACDSYSATLGKLAVDRRLGLLSRSAETRIDQAVIVLAPVCEEIEDVNTEAVVRTVETHLIMMLEEKQNAEN